MRTIMSTNMDARRYRLKASHSSWHRRLSPRASAILAYASQLLSERRYADLTAGIGRVFKRSVLARAQRLGIRHWRIAGLPINAKHQRLSAAGGVEGKPSIIYPSPAAPLLVSVIVPRFNYGQFVSEAVTSALGQAIQSLEGILVGDGKSETPRGG